MADPLTRDQIDDELRRLDQQYDRLAAALLELDEHQGRKLLDGARLTGVTERRWAEAAAAYANLWAYFEAYKETLRLARVVRGDGSRLSRSDAVELSRLIREPALAVPAAPAVRPTLLGTGGTARIGFAAAVTRMDTDYRTVVEVADAADAVWSRLLPGLDAARERQRAAAELVASLGLDAGSSPRPPTWRKRPTSWHGCTRPSAPTRSPAGRDRCRVAPRSDRCGSSRSPPCSVS